jgi:hypothetical protein
MDTNEMRQAMSTLKAFSDKDRASHAYQARAEKEQAQAREAQERAAKEAALAEIARLKAQLHDQGHTDSTPD